MRLGDVLNRMSNASFLLTITGVCDEWYYGSEKIKEETYYKTYKDRKVRSMAILITNGLPELCITLEGE